MTGWGDVRAEAHVAFKRVRIIRMLRRQFWVIIASVVAFVLCVALVFKLEPSWWAWLPGLVGLGKVVVIEELGRAYRRNRAELAQVQSILDDIRATRRNRSWR